MSKGKWKRSRHLYYFEIQVLKFAILWEWEENYWGKVSWETKQRYLQAKRNWKKKVQPVEG